ncbi:MAG: hypothetical protein KDJ65_25510 [Anaerolineae bacterium]|nr:hypothetical protein [Anaerolineae bacterium]
MTKTVISLYDDKGQAQRAVEKLVKSGFSREDISLFAADPNGKYGRHIEYGKVTHYEAIETGEALAATGAVAGGIFGGLGVIFLGLSALAVPGVGPIITAGPIAAGLVGSGIGATVGCLLGTFLGWDVPEEESLYDYDLYDCDKEGIHQEGTFVAVCTPDHQVSRVSNILSAYNPVNLKERIAVWRSRGWTGYASSAE